jgi:hypothetical protein
MNTKVVEYVLELNPPPATEADGFGFGWYSEVFEKKNHAPKIPKNGINVFPQNINWLCRPSILMSGTY